METLEESTRSLIFTEEDRRREKVKSNGTRADKRRN